MIIKDLKVIIGTAEMLIENNYVDGEDKKRLKILLSWEAITVNITELENICIKYMEKIR